jgi:hypothetical protein
MYPWVYTRYKTRQHAIWAAEHLSTSLLQSSFVMGKHHNLLIIYLAALGMLSFPISYPAFWFATVRLAQTEEKRTNNVSKAL